MVLSFHIPPLSYRLDILLFSGQSALKPAISSDLNNHGAEPGYWAADFFPSSWQAPEQGDLSEAALHPERYAFLGW